jgi:hypothetical protein
MSCNLCETGKVSKIDCECQYVKVDQFLRARIIDELIRKKISFDPTMYDDEDWDYVETPQGEFDINFWFPNEKTFAVTAYFMTTDDTGESVRDNTKFFRLFEKEF